jgi:hypothetical protein
MKTTTHGQVRMAQRGFSKALVDLLAQHGSWDGDRQSLGRREIKAILCDLDAMRSCLIRLCDKGGGTAVFGEDDQLITVFSRQKFRRRDRVSFNRPNYSEG